MKAIADNDILLKGACYGFLPELFATVPGDGCVGLLGAARFVVPKKIAQKSLNGDPAAAQARFLSFLGDNELLEPGSEEQELAAFLEKTAQDLALNLDTGESQLVAILVSRCLPSLLTGDKRAITSLEKLMDSDTRLAPVAGKVRCLEQLVKVLLANGNAQNVRGIICAEPSVDKTLSICFSCHGGEQHAATASEGLDSYIAALRSKAARVLAT